MAQGQVQQGLVYERKALDYDAGIYKAYYYLSIGSLVNNNPQSAKSYANWGLISYPHDAELTLFKAVAEYRLNDKNDAMKDASFANTQLQNHFSNYIYTQIFNNQPVIINLH